MNSSRVNTLLIRTPEGIVFPLILASPVTRFLAWIVDLACIAVMIYIAYMLLALIAAINRDFASALLIALYFLISIGYGIATEWLWRGQTVGKRLLKLRVMDSAGLRLQFSQVVIRNLLRFVDNIPLLYALGGVVCVVSRHGQRLGDIAANTIVIRLRETAEPDLDQILAGKYNSFREHPHLAARLRQRTTPEEAGIALQAVLRRNELEAGPRVELFEAIAAHLKTKVQFPQEALEGITDEQYLRNCVDILFLRDQRVSTASQPAKTQDAVSS
jgi:uncharacterized RDD family membrane protein YckC